MPIYFYGLRPAQVRRGYGRGCPIENCVECPICGEPSEVGWPSSPHQCRHQPRLAHQAPEGHPIEEAEPYYARLDGREPRMTPQRG